MRCSFHCVSLYVVTTVTIAAAHGAASSGESIYRATCSTCHDSGAGHAPRIAVPQEWGDRFPFGRAALQSAAIRGVPNTAMAPKGGFSELSDDEVKAAVDYMLGRTGFVEPEIVRASARPVPRAVAPGEPIASDVVLMARAAAAIRDALASSTAPIEHVESELVVRGIGIRVRSLEGVVRLMGVVPDAVVVKRAEAVVVAIPGVRGVDNRLVTGGMLDFD